MPGQSPTAAAAAGGGGIGGAAGGGAAPAPAFAPTLALTLEGGAQAADDMVRTNVFIYAAARADGCVVACSGVRCCGCARRGPNARALAPFAKTGHEESVQAWEEGRRRQAEVDDRADVVSGYGGRSPG
eukprot:COSAG04_NODE_13751_length_593_cov_1.289474_2_plen_128_part_01